jgi:hypothetical protein
MVAFFSVELLTSFQQVINSFILFYHSDSECFLTNIYMIYVI